MNLELKSEPKIDLIIPCFNEADSAENLIKEIERVVLDIISVRKLDFSIVIIDDGSADGTAQVFQNLLEASSAFKQGCILSFSRNFGKEAALFAGLENSFGDACIIMDADLQDPPTLIHDMILQWELGFKIVNAVRRKRNSDGFFKRLTARLFYSSFAFLSHLDIQINASDYRLLDRVAVKAILSCPERIRFSKGFFAWIGHNHSNVYFERPNRITGSTKRRAWRLWNYALDGIFNFSTIPLRVWSYIGLIVTILAFLWGLTIAVRTFFFGVDVPGYASLFVAITFLGGLQLLGIGIIGEYIGRIFIESKGRPHYILRQVVQLPRS